MIKVTVLNKSGSVGWGGTFASEEEADVWISYNVENNLWGKPSRWATEDQEDVSTAIDIRERHVSALEPVVDEETGEIIEDGLVTIKEYLIPSEYQVQKSDVTAEHDKEALIANGKSRQSLGADVIAKVYSINEHNGISAQKFSQLMSDPTIQTIERLLWTGSLRTAKILIQGLDSYFFSEEEKQQILNMLSEY